MRTCIQISAGVGPEECCWVVSRVGEEIAREAKRRGIKASELRRSPSSYPGNCHSIAMELSGDGSVVLASGWYGTVQWIGTSPYRAHHRRKNWFVSVTPMEEVKPETIESERIQVETKRGSGAGGQNRNKRDTAVRIRMGNVVVSASDERSQWRNKVIAVERLEEAIAKRNERSLRNADEKHRSAHYALVRGNPVRTYVGKDFKPK